MTSPDYPTERGGFSLDVNRRQAFGTLLMGCSRVDIVKFAAAMNMPPPALQRTFDSNIESIGAVMTQVRRFSSRALK